MKKLILLIIILILTLSLSGCRIFDLDGWVVPNDTKFIALVQELDTPRKICQYMKDNFEYEAHPSIDLTPYQLYTTRKGDCYDLSTFAIKIADYHDYTTYLIIIAFEETFKAHALAVYLENGQYTYSSNKEYYPICASSFREIALDLFKFPIGYELGYYIVYDHWDNLVEQGTK